MKFSVFKLAAAFSLLFLVAMPVKAQVLYWDNNDVTPGTGATPTGTWGTDNFWNSDAAGINSTTGWTDSRTAVFAAGTDATNAYTVTVTGTRTISGINFEEGNVTLSGGNINLTGSTPIDVAASSSASISSVIGGGIVVLSKTGPGTLAITANNTFLAGVIVNGGVLSFPGETSTTAGASNPLGAAPGAATPGYITLNAGSTLRSTKIGAVAANTSYVIPNRGIAISGGVTLETTDATTNRALLYSGIIAGSDGLTKTGGGTLILGGVNTYSGDTIVSAGGLGVTATGKFGDGTGTLVLAGGDIWATTNRTFANSLANPILMQASTTIHAFSNAFTAGTHSINFKTTSIVATNGTLTLANHGAPGTNTLFLVQFNTMGGLQFDRPIVLGAGCRLDLWNDDINTDAVFSGDISGSGNMQYTSSGTGTGGSTVVTGFNTYSGTNSVNGGYIGFGSDSLPPTGTITSGPIGTGTLFVKWDPTVGIFAHGGPRTVRNTISFVTVDNFRIIGTNDLTMSGALSLNSSNLTFTVDNTGVTTFGGVISGGSAGKTLTKAGSGALVFSGANTYVINTIISAGALLVNNTSGSGTGTGTVTVDSGGILGGIGAVSKAVSGVGNIAPGINGAGKLTLQNGLNLSTGGGYVWELGALVDGTNAIAGTDYDQLSLTAGTLVLDGVSKLSINFTNLATAPNASNAFWQTTRTWKICALSGSATNPGFSRFQVLENATYDVGSFTNTVDGSGNVWLTFVSTNVTPPAPLISSAINGAGTTNATLSWSAANGVNYQLQYKDDLNSTNWLSLGTTTATGNSASLSDTTGPVPRRFYRVIVP